MNLDQQLSAAGITQDMFASVFNELAPSAPARPENDLASELLTIMHQHQAVSIFKLGQLHLELTGRCHHQRELWYVMDDLERAGKVKCDFSAGERVWHLA